MYAYTPDKQDDTERFIQMRSVSPPEAEPQHGQLAIDQPFQDTRSDLTWNFRVRRHNDKRTRQSNTLKNAKGSLGSSTEMVGLLVPSNACLGLLEITSGIARLGVIRLISKCLLYYSRPLMSRLGTIPVQILCRVPWRRTKIIGLHPCAEAYLSLGRYVPIKLPRRGLVLQYQHHSYGRSEAGC